MSNPEKRDTCRGIQLSHHTTRIRMVQDVVAMSCLELAHRNGHWVILNNIHLMPSWLIELEKKLDEFALEGSHEKFRLYLSSDPSNAIPIGVLSRCIKLTNEPPAGLKANLKRAFANFSREYIEEVSVTMSSVYTIAARNSVDKVRLRGRRHHMAVDAIEATLGIHSGWVTAMR